MATDLPELDSLVAWQGLLGYLNFSEGKPDPRFQKALNGVYVYLADRGEAEPWKGLHDVLRGQLARLRAAGTGGFQDVTQAEAVLGLIFSGLLPAYRAHHADLLFHQSERDLFQSFFIARAVEAVLAQGPPWTDDVRIVKGALQRLNDYVGHRPVAVLENRPRGEPYPHERCRPIPLFIRGAGVAGGPYAGLVGKALEILAAAPPEILTEACFDPELLDELALDPRAYDHGHPVNKRPNYVFGEWDPHHIDGQGRYRRYVVRQVTLDALRERVENPGPLPPGEVLFEAAAVLAGTILMAAGISGAGPETHDSSATLATLMPRIARYRDAFYAQLLAGLPEPHRTRQRQEAAVTKQPFGAARQHLNQFLAGHRALLLQQRHLALLLADMGYPEASRRQAGRIPAASVRFLSEIHIRLTAGQLAAGHGDLAGAARLAAEVEDLLHRGIACGALADPWNILGFQGQFPLASATEDSVHDNRIDELVHAVEQLFNLESRIQSEAGARGEAELIKEVRTGLKRVAGWWDQFASVEVSGIRRVQGGEAAASAEHVAEALLRWHRQGAATADLAFWRKHLGNFRSPKAFALVVDALLRKEDYKAAMALLINWLGQAEQVPLEDGDYSFGALALRWMLGVNTQASRPAEADVLALKKRFLDYLEANAEEYWTVPGPAEESAEELGMPQEEEDLYGAAYEDVTYRDSTADGEDSEVAEGGPRQEFDLEHEANALLRRLQFLATVARLWQIASWRPPEADGGPTDPGRAEILRGWLGQARHNRQALLRLLDHLHEHPVPQPTGNYESLVEYDRHRHLKEQLVSAALATCLDTTLAVGALLGASAADTPAALDDPDLPPWNALAIRLEQALFHGDAAEARAVLPDFVRLFRQEPLLFQPLGAGGHPRQVLRAGIAQNVLRALVAHLPRLGLLRETFHLLRVARGMEQAAPAGEGDAGRRVTVFDQLFQAALQTTVEVVVESSAAWEPTEEPARRLTDLLDEMVEPFVKLWLDHCQTLRLSSLEAVRGEAEWNQLRGFVRRYGADLFHARFMTLGNLRGILHRGVGAYLDYLIDNPDPLRPVRLLDDLDRTIPRAAAERYLETILSALVENYEEYKDYNTTTTQSDYGENIHLLLDFLTVKVGYDRQAWYLRPLVLVHEVLVRKGQREAAGLWQEEFTELTEDKAAELREALAELEQGHGMRLRTISDHLEERFVKPLALDRLRALVEPAMEQAGGATPGPAFIEFEKELGPYQEGPTGVGLDVPHWLRWLELEVQRIRAAGTAIAGLALQLVRVPRTVVSLEDVQRQLREWDKPLEGGQAGPPPST